MWSDRHTPSIWNHLPHPAGTSQSFPWGVPTADSLSRAHQSQEGPPTSNLPWPTPGSFHVDSQYSRFVLTMAISAAHLSIPLAFDADPSLWWCQDWIHTCQTSCSPDLLALGTSATSLLNSTSPVLPEGLCAYSSSGKECYSQPPPDLT